MTNNETYFEFDDNLNEGFTTIPNYILNDTRLTFKAVGVYVQILQYRNTGRHKVYLKSLSNYRQDKKTAVSSALKELEETGYISKTYLRNTKGQIQGIKYTVRMKPIVEVVGNTTSEPKAENLTSDNPTSDFTTLKIKCLKKKMFKKENIDDVVAEKTPSEKIIELYKTFKIEKRVMPHSLNLLKQYADTISLEVFEYIFIQASEESVPKKYSYIKTLLEDFTANKIFTLDDLTKYNQSFKDKKSAKENKPRQSKNTKVNTKLHNVNETYAKYKPDQLENIAYQNQKDKFNIVQTFEDDDSATKGLYLLAVNEGKFDEMSEVSKQLVREYAEKHNLLIP